MKSYAGRSDVDYELELELSYAGIWVVKLPECMRSDPAYEVHTVIVGDLLGWTFRRYWYYWVCKGPGIPVDIAEELHSRFGKEVRVAGHCNCPSPREWYKGLGCGEYHVDTKEGLKALADTIRKCADTVLKSEQSR